ncbi:phage tail tape measure protein [Streptomyces sp. A13(2022)]|uniref:phage tail tape measure protein n=1 Tax=Streptomyces sp. A13(2022) TaxID=2964768 RepID=UPI0021DA4A61|nr:phage tail tape measure protein [Streptomyces sp. A13(2022)]MCU8589919.1 phage tail tape measure protein [Streptomyces sp. A13(2022)]
MPVEVGVGYVSVVPEARGFGRLLGQQIRGDSVSVGTTAGQDAGRGFLGGIGGVVKAGVVGVAAAGGALFAAGFSKAVEQDKSSAKLGAQLGLTEKESARAGKIAGGVYAKGYGESVDQVNDALKGLAQNGVASINAPRKELEGLSRSALNLAETFDADVGESTKAVGQLIRTGLVKNGKEGFDLLTAGFQSGADKAGDLIDTVNEYSTQWRKAGLDGSTAIGLIGQALQAGARDGDVAADAIKEFSLRAIDGSKTTADGFKMLGLNADDMAARFGKGGKYATSVLDVTLDRLRGIKDPVKQAAAATALFGTQSEDLGAALYAMDPSTAAAGLGKVGGAADRMGKTLHNTATQPLEVFKRQALQGLANVATKYALPAVERLGNGLNRYVLPPAKTVGGALLNVLVPAAKSTGEAFAGGVQWVKDYGAWLIPLGIAIGGVAVVAGASTIATWGMTAAFTVYRGAVLATSAVTRGWAAAQTVLNAVMSANPIGLIIVGVVALGAALVVAYQKSETFRTIVQGAWQGLQTGIQALGAAATWLWSTVLSPVFSAIGLGARILATVLLTVLITPVYLAVKGLGVVFSWLWDVAIGPTFSLMTSGAKAVWAGTNVVFGYFKAGLLLLGAAFKWLYSATVKPTFSLMASGAKVVWAATNTIFGYFKTGLRILGSAFSSLWKSSVSPAMSGIRSVVSVAYTLWIKPIFDKLRSATNAVGNTFGSAVKVIKREWNKIEGIAKAPVKFVIDTVYNGGVVKVWNAIASKFGAPKLDKVTGFARGGVLAGQSSYRQGDDQLVPMRKGEGVYVSEAMRDPYERARLFAVNAAAMRGQSLAQYQGEGFAKGGIFGWVKSAASKGIDLAKTGLSWLKDGVKASAEAGLNKVVRPLLDRIAGSKSAYRDMISGVPKRMIKEIIGYSGKADTELEKAGIGGKGYKAGLAWAWTQNGKRYQWGGNGNPSWDCSGLVSAIESVIRGQKPHRRWATGAFSGRTAPAGWQLNKRSPYMIGITNSGVGHTAGTINGVNVESRGGDGVVIGSRARSYKDGLFTHHYGFTGKGYADGGKPRRGEVAWVGERGPELLQFGGGQTVHDNESSMRLAAADVGAALVASMARSIPAQVPTAGVPARSVTPVAGGQPVAREGDTYNINARTVDMTVRDLELLQRKQDAKARVGRPN